MSKSKKYISFILAAIISLSLVACSRNSTVSSVSSAPAATASLDLTSDIKSSEEYIEYINEKYNSYVEMEYGLDITKKVDLVGICYTTWFTAVLGPDDSGIIPPNISNILDGNETWGKTGQFHYWAEPALGYYCSNNKEVIRTHMTQLAEMGADYIIIDNTNAQMKWKYSSDWTRFITLPCTAILDTIVEMRTEGLETPYVVFWNKTSDGHQNWDVVEAIYDEFISIEKWKDCFVYWEGKPFVLTTSDISGEPACDVTTRMQWGLNQNLGTSEWSFLNVENIPSVDTNGFAEQICVCTATQETLMSNTSTAHGRNHGIFMYEQWQNAFIYRPKAITITWWNEWCAQLSYSANGTPQFVDNYNQEYSRDIEPMKGGHGDQYYQWTKQYIAAYKNHESCPRLVEEGY